MEAFFHLTPNISYPLMLVISALTLPVMIVRFYMGWFQMVTIDLPLIIASFWSISAFYLMAQHELFPKNWKRTLMLAPMLLAAGVALTLVNAKAVIEALLGIKTGFARTAKYAISDRKVKIESTAYQRRSGWIPYAGDRDRHLFPDDDKVRHRHVEFPRDPVPAALRGWLLVGRLHHAVSGIAGTSALAA